MAEYWKTDGEVEVLGTPFGGTDISDIRTKIGIVGSFIAERLPANMLAVKNRFDWEIQIKHSLQRIRCKKNLMKHDKC